ncbi:unnamed protein product, partial [marine sediment metagenome]
IARAEDSPTVESLSASYPLLSRRELESIMAMSREADS